VKDKKIKILIPARFNSSRFPGKPLVLILGKPLIVRVAEICSEAIGKENVFIVTDDTRIKNLCESYGYHTLYSEYDAQTGTDRIAAVIDQIESDIVLNVQGDEPCISRVDILNAIQAKIEFPNHIINGYCEFEAIPSKIKLNIPKVVVNESSELIYISRANIPIEHKKYVDDLPANFLRQVCIYAYNSQQLKAFYGFSRRSIVESKEDIEILRFMELGIKIKMIKMSSSVAVDYPEDILLVEQFIKSKAN
jgi:3-deoxy-manno-octulosonate cytidylyltransferase (CMP-KDO synthetase)